jgi:hypothetical protein
MPYGTIKVDTITFTNAGVDKSVSISGLVQNPTFTGNVTATGTISGLIVQAPTVTGTTANFASGVYTTQISGAIVKVPAGSAGAPSIQVGVGASVAPGLYGAGTDLLGISTGGAGRIFIDSTGRLGVGTSSPSSPLHVLSSSTLIATFSGPANAYLDVTDGTGVFRVQLSSNTPVIGSSTNHGLIFNTNATERMRILAGGNVGIGTGNPQATLDVGAKFRVDTTSAFGVLSLARPDGTHSPFIRGADSAGTASALRLGDVGGSQAAMDISAAGNIIFYTNTATTERLRIDSSGQLTVAAKTNGVTNGIIYNVPYTGGQANAVSQVLAAATGTANALARINMSTVDLANTNGSFISFATSAGGGGSPVGDLTTEKMRISPVGNVGIGTTSPTAKLTVYGDGTSTDTLDVVNPSATNGATIRFADVNSSSAIKTIPASSTHSLGFFVADATVERMRIDSSGRVLVGTSTSFGVGTSNAGQLQVADTSIGIVSLSTFANTGNGAFLMLGKSRGTSIGSYTVVQANDQLGTIRFAGSDGTSFQTFGASIEAYVDGTPGTNNMPGRLVFSTTADGASSPTERMRIRNSGFTNLFVTANDGFQSRNSAAAGTTLAVFAGRHSATSTTDGTISFQVWTNGNVQNTNNSYTAISDIKLKENIVDASSQWADLKALRVRNYNLKEGQTHKQIGLVAQEVEPISPGLVYESPDRDAEGNDLGTVTKSVNYSVLYMKAVKALQEAMERIETLEAKVAALEGN